VTQEKPERLAFLFDLDGVLVHSMPLHVEAWEAYLAGLGITVVDLERRMHGMRNFELVHDLIGSDISDDVAFHHGAAKEGLWRQMMLENGIDNYRVPGAYEFVKRHADHPMAIGSNAEPANIDFVLDQFGFRPYFRVTVNGQQVERGKPAPDIYLKAAELLGSSPRDCIVFEDSPTGVEAGIAAGMRVVGVETTPTDYPHVDLRIDNFIDPQLERWLAAQNAY
jgi:HAD superfamily hydrolase (TIGR01549 family)